MIEVSGPIIEIKWRLTLEEIDILIWICGQRANIAKTYTTGHSNDVTDLLHNLHTAIADKRNRKQKLAHTNCCNYCGSGDIS